MLEFERSGKSFEVRINLTHYSSTGYYYFPWLVVLRHFPSLSLHAVSILADSASAVAPRWSHGLYKRMSSWKEILGFLYHPELHSPFAPWPIYPKICWREMIGMIKVAPHSNIRILYLFALWLVIVSLNFFSMEYGFINQSVIANHHGY